MEVLDLLNAMEEFVEESTRIPMTGKILIDADELLDYVDRVRAVLPEEVKQAKWITREHQRIIADAEQEAKRLVMQAQEDLSKQAEESQIAAQAQEYADEVLRTLESQVDKFSQELRKGREELGRTIQRKAAQQK
ncbi:MAG TPA: ATPase [Bacillota bacterium]|nr:ATPase [Bacillota bacterium]